MKKDDYLNLLTKMARIEPTEEILAILTDITNSAVLLHTPYRQCAVECVETGEIFESIAQASRIIGCSKSSMSNHLNGRFKTVKGKHYIRCTITQEVV